MVWFLLVCTHVYSGSQCLALQPMPSQSVCRFARTQYIQADGPWTAVSAKCIGWRK